MEDPKTVIRSAAGHEGHGQNPVLCKAACKRHTALNRVPLYRAGFALIERDAPQGLLPGDPFTRGDEAQFCRHQ